MIRQVQVLFLLFLWAFSLQAQENNEPKNKAFTATLFNFSYGFQQSGGDLAERYGTSSTFGFSPEFSYKRWLLGVETNFLFGGNVKQDVLAALRTPDGFIIGEDREYVDVSLFQRGFHFGVHAGRIFPINQSRSGIRFTAGAGFLQHRIKIQNETQTALPVLGEYRKGYDRLTNGLALKQFIGYHYFSSNTLINFFAGFEFYQAFTTNKRAVDYDTMVPEVGTRTDLLYGFKIGWTVPIFHYDPDKDFY